MNINLDAAELDLLVEALDAMVLSAWEPCDDDLDIIALRAKLAGTCR